MKALPNAAIDLFCGIGGLTKGLELAGINVIAGFDFEESCRYAYEQNNNARFIHSDITKLEPQEVADLYPENSVRILAGCAPCQPFSKYSQRYRKDGYKDDKWRLLYSFSNIIENVMPDIIAMENVPELEKTKVFQDFENKLAELGYHTFSRIVFCPDYGVPQKRKRLVFLASIYGEIELQPPTHNPENYNTVRGAIEGLPAIDSGETDENDKIHTATRLNGINIRRIEASVPGGTWRDWPDDLKLSCHKKGSGKSYSSVYGRMQWDLPSPTITTQFYGYGNGRFGHPEQNRAISLREGALLQSFPADYQFAPADGCINKRALGTQIGNAVPVELGRVIGITITEHIGRYVNVNEENY